MRLPAQSPAHPRLLAAHAPTTQPALAQRPAPALPCRLSTQLARTEEAAKRALLKGDASARGGTAQALLDTERENQRLRGDLADVSAKLAR